MRRLVPFAKHAAPILGTALGEKVGQTLGESIAQRVSLMGWTKGHFRADSIGPSRSSAMTVKVL